jgi:hypothetical protein
LGPKAIIQASAPAAAEGSAHVGERSLVESQPLSAELPDTQGVALRRAERIAWATCIAVLATWAVMYVTWPFSNDQGNLAWVGDVILSGGMPYRDAWDVKGPGAHVAFALIETLFGRNEWGVRVFDLGLLAVCVVCLRSIAREYAGPGAVRWSIALFLLWYASLNHHNTAQPDAWAGVMVTGAVALMLTRTRLSPVSGAGAGVLIGICALIKPTYILFFALPVLDGLCHVRVEGVGRVTRFWLASAVGLAAPIALCVWWFSSRGALDDWIAVHLDWIPSSYTQVDAAWMNRGQYLLAFLTTGPFAPVVPLVVGGLYVVRRQSSRDVLMLVAWVLLAACGVLIQGQFYPYHWHPIYPPLALLAGIGLDALWSWITDTAAKRRAERDAQATVREIPLANVVGAAISVVVLIGATTAPVVHLYRYARAVGADDFSGYERIEFGPFGHHGGVFPELVDYLRARSGPHESVLVWGSAAGVNYLADRPAVAPFGFVQPLVDPPDTELRRRYRERFMARLTSTPPRYVVALNAAACARSPSPSERQLLGRAEGLIRCLDDLPALDAFVKQRFAMERMIGPLEVWRAR